MKRLVQRAILFWALPLIFTLCFHGCTTEYIYVISDENAVASSDELDPDNSDNNLGDNTGDDADGDWDLEDDEYYLVPGDGTRENPYTVSQALEMLDSGTYDPDKGYYVKGYVSCRATIITWFEGLYTIGYYMSEDGHYSWESDFFVDNGFALGGEYFTSQDALSAGDKVIVYGRFAIDELNNDRREMACGKLYYWNGEFGDLDDDEYFMEHGDGSKENPYSVSQAVEMLNSGTYDPDKNYYVKGIVSWLWPNAIGIYYISDDGCHYWTETSLYVDGYGLGGEPFSSEDVMSPLDQVIVYGKLSLDSGQPTMYDGKLYYWNGKTADEGEGFDEDDGDKDDDDQSGDDSPSGLPELPDLEDVDDVCTKMTDSVFKQYCLNNFDTNHNGKISMSEAVNVYEVICDNRARDFAGIEYFSNLQSFSSYNAESVDLRYNTELTSVYMYNDSYLCELDLRYNTKLEVIEEYAFASCSNLSSVALPESLTSIGAKSFNHCPMLTSIEFPKNLASISSSAFLNCTSLASVSFSENSLTRIGGNAFEGCTSLVSISFPENSLSEIRLSAFVNCTGLTSIGFPESLTYVMYYAFDGCTNLEKVTFSENNLAVIDYNAFQNCTSLRTVENLATVGENVFNGCVNLTMVTFSKNSKSKIGTSAFSDCTNLTNVTFPKNSLTLIEERAFYNCRNLTTVLLSETNLKEIEEEAFCECSSLASVTLPDCVTDIGNSAFSGCSSLETVSIEAATPPYLGKSVFYNISDAAKLYVPPESVEAYANSGWAQWFSQILPIE